MLNYPRFSWTGWLRLKCYRLLSLKYLSPEVQLKLTNTFLYVKPNLPLPIIGLSIHLATSLEGKLQIRLSPNWIFSQSILYFHLAFSLPIKLIPLDWWNEQIVDTFSGTNEEMQKVADILFLENSWGSSTFFAASEDWLEYCMAMSKPKVTMSQWILLSWEKVFDSCTLDTMAIWYQTNDSIGLRKLTWLSVGTHWPCRPCFVLVLIVLVASFLDYLYLNQHVSDSSCGSSQWQRPLHPHPPFADHISTFHHPPIKCWRKRKLQIQTFSYTIWRIALRLISMIRLPRGRGWKHFWLLSFSSPGFVEPNGVVIDRRIRLRTGDVWVYEWMG